MKINRLFILPFILSILVQFAESFLFEGIGIGIGAFTALGYGAFHCKYYECCDDYNIPFNATKLYYEMKEHLYGQHIAQHIVYRSIKSHISNSNPRKPLVLSFHGGTGTGKNYVASMIAESLFKLGERSKYFHFFNGRGDFPHSKSEDIVSYQMIIKEKVEKALNSCERSLFVFDEVDKIAPRVLDVLVPFLDYTNWSKYENKKAIFIFISNTGSGLIVRKMIELWQNGMKREEIDIDDFEPLIQRGAFNEEGGLKRSSTIETKLIDYHVPFLPLEEKHVIECLIYVLELMNVFNPSKNLINKGLKHIIYGPSPHQLYSTSGCKTFEHRVSSILGVNEFDN